MIWDGVSEFVMPAGNVTITPVFKAKTNKLTVDIDSGAAAVTNVKIGSADAVNLAGKLPNLDVKTGETVVFTLEVDGSLTVADAAGSPNKVTVVSGNGTKVVTITMPAGDASITIK